VIVVICVCNDVRWHIICTRRAAKNMVAIIVTGSVFVKRVGLQILAGWIKIKIYNLYVQITGWTEFFFKMYNNTHLFIWTCVCHQINCVLLACKAALPQNEEKHLSKFILNNDFRMKFGNTDNIIIRRPDPARRVRYHPPTVVVVVSCWPYGIGKVRILIQR